ncbi:hypothetical protein HZS_6430, partial [Henneguya salminicola]
RALNIRVETRIPLQTAADFPAPKKRRRGEKRHKAAENGDKWKDSGVKKGHKGPARPKGSQRPNTGSKAKAAAKRHRTARPAKARGPSQQLFRNPCTQAPAPCAHSAYPGYPPLPGYCCCRVAPFQAPLRSLESLGPDDTLSCAPPKDAIEEAEDKDESDPFPNSSQLTTRLSTTAANQ